MTKLLLALLLSGIVVVVSEVLWRLRLLKGEYARKSVHIIIGLIVAFLPYIMTWHQVQLVGAISFSFIVLMRLTGLTKSWYDIDRLSWGEILGPGSFLLLAFFEPPRILFLTACLNVALADGFAAVVGQRFGRRQQYKVFGYTKSIPGTLTFFTISLAIMIGVAIFGGAGVSVSWAALLTLPVVITIIENIAVFGVDNMLIIGTTVILFRLFSIA